MSNRKYVDNCSYGTFFCSLIWTKLIPFHFFPLFGDRTVTMCCLFKSLPSKNVKVNNKRGEIVLYIIFDI